MNEFHTRKMNSSRNYLLWKRLRCWLGLGGVGEGIMVDRVLSPFMGCRLRIIIKYMIDNDVLDRWYKPEKKRKNTTHKVYFVSFFSE